MGAIGAIWNFDGAVVAREDLAALGNALRIHGSPREGKQNLGRAALAWTRRDNFSAHDRHDAQPILCDETCFVFTGRIAYRGDLGRSLGIDLSYLNSMSDCQLAFRAWREWGEGSFDRLEGEWSLIVADLRSGQLIAVRSPMSAPPLYYARHRQTLVLASTPSGVFSYPGIERALDEQSIADSIVSNFSHPEATFYLGLSSIPTGHSLNVRDKSVGIRKWHSFAGVADVRFGRDEEYFEAARALLRDAVDDAMIALQTPACMVSGGLDSTAVTVSALETLNGGERLLGFTHVPEPGWDGRAYGSNRIGNERPGVEALMAMYPQIRVDFVDGSGQSLDSESDRLFRLAEVPGRGWNNQGWTSEIRRRTRASGRQVLLGGRSGNRTMSFSLLSGLPRQFLTGRWIELQANLRGLQTNEGPISRFHRFVLRPALPDALRKNLREWRGKAMHGSPTSYAAIGQAYAAEFDVLEREAVMPFHRRFGPLTTLRERMIAFAEDSFPSIGASMTLAQQTSTGVQYRDPLGCRRITEFCIGLPDKCFIHKGVDRRLIKRTMGERLPVAIVQGRRGRQSADWHLKMTRDLVRYRYELDRMEEDADHRHRFDIPRLRKVIDTWPELTPLGPHDHPDYLVAMVGLGRAIGTARFIDWVNGRN